MHSKGGHKPSLRFSPSLPSLTSALLLALSLLYISSILSHRGHKIAAWTALPSLHVGSSFSKVAEDKRAASAGANSFAPGIGDVASSSQEQGPAGNLRDESSRGSHVSLLSIFSGSSVLRVVSLENQLLLVVHPSLPFSSSHPSKLPTTAAAAAAGEVACVFSAGSPHQGVSAALSLSHNGRVAFVRCPLPGTSHGPGSPVTVALMNSETVELVQRQRSRHRSHKARDLRADLAATLDAPAQSDSIDHTFHLLPSSAILGPSNASAPEDGVVRQLTPEVEAGAEYVGQRLVMECLEDHAGVYVFVKGVYLKQRFNALLRKQSHVSCVFGRGSGGHELERVEPSSFGKGLVWTAFPKSASNEKNLVLVCPHPPPDVVRAWLEAAGNFNKPDRDGRAKTLQGDKGRLQEGDPGSSFAGRDVLVPVTIQDSAGFLPSVAFFNASHGPLPRWRPQKPSAHAAACKGSGLHWGRPRLSSSEDPGGGVYKGRVHHLCACTVLRDEAKFLGEWVRYHSWMGVERFFIYDNNSGDELEEVAARLARTVNRPRRRGEGVRGGQRGESWHKKWEEQGEEVEVEVLPWPWVKTQQAAFSHCLLRAGPRCNWTSFIDVDEFLFPQFLVSSRNDPGALEKERAGKGPFLHHWIAEAERTACPKPLGAISVGSVTFGPSGQDRTPPEGVIRGYTCRLDKPGFFKSIVRPESVNLDVHNFVHTFSLTWHYYTLRGPSQRGLLYHYQFQAWEDYRRKFDRRVAAGVRDWKRSTDDRPRGDGVVILEGDPEPPPDWKMRFCEVRDTSLTEFITTVFGSGGLSSF